MRTGRILLLPLAALLILAPSCNNAEYSQNEAGLFREAAANGIIVNEGFNRCLDYVSAWLDLADSTTGLIPRNINDRPSRDIWNAKDCAADNYPFMVLTAAILDRRLFAGTMTDMLDTEIKLTSRLGAMPDTWSFSARDFAEKDTVIADIIFGSAEYVKDGLMPLTEWLGPSRWSDRMIAIVDEMWARAPVSTEAGMIVSDNPEVNGDMLQALSRLYWFTGNEKYLEYAVRLGDYYLLGDNHPTRNFRVLRLRDHGCEIVSGLCELYATVAYADTVKKKIYQPHIHQMLDRILEKGRNEDMLFYNSIDPVAGIPVNDGIADNFGYTLNGFYTVYLIDGVEKYRTPVLEALGSLKSGYTQFAWEGSSSDGYADAIEGALNLLAREPVGSASEWTDTEIRVMWAKQQESGIIEGWHGDGNFARTTIMYCLEKTQGLWAEPWQGDLMAGAVSRDSALYISISSETGWKGRLMLDRERHREYMRLPLDWPRINQFPEYFTIRPGEVYEISENTPGKSRSHTYEELKNGYEIRIKPKQTVYIKVSR